MGGASVDDGRTSEGFRRGFQGIWAGFITNGEPWLDELDMFGGVGNGRAKGARTGGGGLGLPWGNGTRKGDGDSDADSREGEGVVAAAGRKPWLPWGDGDFTETGGPGPGLEGRVGRYGMLNLNVTNGPDIRADWSVVDGLAWEGGRGKRCDLWAAVGVR